MMEYYYRIKTLSLNLLALSIFSSQLQQLQIHSELKKFSGLEQLLEKENSFYVCKKKFEKKMTEHIIKIAEISRLWSNFIRKRWLKLFLCGHPKF